MNSSFGMSRHMPGFNKEAILKVHARGHNIPSQGHIKGLSKNLGVITKSFEETRAYKNKPETEVYILVHCDYRL